MRRRTLGPRAEGGQAASVQGRCVVVSATSLEQIHELLRLARTQHVDCELSIEVCELFFGQPPARSKPGHILCNCHDSECGGGGIDLAKQTGVNAGGNNVAKVANVIV